MQKIVPEMAIKPTVRNEAGKFLDGFFSKTLSEKETIKKIDTLNTC